ncbi:flavin reductase family protein [Streptomyces sp. NPDC002896]|uniref:flavin reductase family protein n=1 Tax=Streptomyces sp. NPDC002896 TaxID=3154438 RepID=UPI0033197EC9
MSLQPVSGDAAGFKAALGSFAAGVNVITLRDDEGRPLGMTATAFSSVSADPLLVLVCMNRSTRSYEQVAATGRFGVNILAAAAREVSDHCSRPGSDKYLAPEWLAEHSEWHAPALAGALAYLDCETERDVTAGTHAVLIARVRAIGLDTAAPLEKEPLLHFRGGYRQLQRTAPQPRPLATSVKEYA